MNEQVEQSEQQQKPVKHYPKMRVFTQLWQFMRVRKKWWLAPIIIILFFFGILLLFAQTSPLAPLLYPLF
jgi:hypothetical protein